MEKGSHESRMEAHARALKAGYFNRQDVSVVAFIGVSKTHDIGTLFVESTLDDDHYIKSKSVQQLQITVHTTDVL